MTIDHAIALIIQLPFGPSSRLGRPSYRVSARERRGFSDHRRLCSAAISDAHGKRFTCEHDQGRSEVICVAARPLRWRSKAREAK